jgi:restriction endonuclease Mrr
MLGAVAQYDATQGVIATTSTFAREAIKVFDVKPNRLTGHDFGNLVNLLWRVQMVIVPRIGAMTMPPLL